MRSITKQYICRNLDDVNKYISSNVSDDFMKSMIAILNE